MKFWKIRRKSDGLFYEPCSQHKFNTVGKAYHKLKPINDVIQNILCWYGDIVEVIEYEAVEKSVVSAEEFMS